MPSNLFPDPREPRPLVGVVSDVKTIGPHSYHVAGDKYLRALTHAAKVVPVIIPCLRDEIDIGQWAGRLDGILLTGAYSMLDPAHYGQSPQDPELELDQQRDALSFALIHAAIDANMPLLGACRGIQDINVALGGSLHQTVHEVAGKHDHREDRDADLDEQYGPAHPVELTRGGLLHEITGETRLTVNSLHVQGLDRLAPDLTIEARAEDGLVEAVSINALSFGLAVQWHPEWKVMDNPPQQRILAAFGRACHRQMATKR